MTAVMLDGPNGGEVLDLEGSAPSMLDMSHGAYKLAVHSTKDQLALYVLDRDVSSQSPNNEANAFVN